MCSPIFFISFIVMFLVLYTSQSEAITHNNILHNQHNIQHVTNQNRPSKSKLKEKNKKIQGNNIQLQRLVPENSLRRSSSIWSLGLDSNDEEIETFPVVENQDRHVENGSGSSAIVDHLGAFLPSCPNAYLVLLENEKHVLSQTVDGNKNDEAEADSDSDSDSNSDEKDKEELNSGKTMNSFLKSGIFSLCQDGGRIRVRGI